MLKIENLKVRVGETMILNGLSLTVPTGELHAIMGPNGAGKSTLANALAGREGYEVVAGSIEFNGTELLELDPHERAAAGVFLGFQYPVEIPGVSNLNFLRTALNSIRTMRGDDELSAADFLKLLKEKAADLEMSLEMQKRGVNVGFSGGEKKRNEMLQMAVLDPSLAILDETDSGLDIDALKIVAKGMNSLHGPDKTMLVITHYQRLLDYVVPDKVHVLANGKITKSGDKSLALELEEKGYGAVA